MVFLPRQKGLARISHPDLLQRKILEKLGQQVTARKVLQPLVGMRNILLEGNFGQEKILRLFDPPDGQPGRMVDIMLIK